MYIIDQPFVLFSFVSLLSIHVAYIAYLCLVMYLSCNELLLFYSMDDLNDESAFVPDYGPHDDEIPITSDRVRASTSRHKHGRQCPCCPGRFTNVRRHASERMFLGTCHQRLRAGIVNFSLHKCVY